MTFRQSSSDPADEAGTQLPHLPGTLDPAPDDAAGLNGVDPRGPDRPGPDRCHWLVQHAVIGIYRSTLDGRFVEVNPALVSMLGYSSQEELASVPVMALYRDPRDRRILLDRFRYATDVKDVEVEWRRKDGRAIVVRLNGRWLSDEEDGEGFEMFVEDVTERRALEDRLHEAQKMEAAGKLAGDVAHKVTRLMTAILGYADLLARHAEGNDDVRRHLAEITRAAERAFTLSRPLLGDAGDRASRK